MQWHFLFLHLNNCIWLNMIADTVWLTELRVENIKIVFVRRTHSIQFSNEIKKTTKIRLNNAKANIRTSISEFQIKISILQAINRYLSTTVLSTPKWHLKKKKTNTKTNEWNALNKCTGLHMLREIFCCFLYFCRLYNQKSDSST